MLDWNGDGKIDPVDVGISIAARDYLTEEEEPIEDMLPLSSGVKTAAWRTLLSQVHSRLFRKRRQP